MPQRKPKPWYQRIWEWVKKLFAPGVKPKPPQILKYYYGTPDSQCTVLQIERRTKGAIATFRVVPKGRGASWLLCLDDLRELETVNLGKYDGTPINLRATNDLGRQLGHTHGFSLFKIPEGANPVRVGAWNLNLAGNVARSELAVQTIALCVALHLLRIPQGKAMSWAQQVEDIDWGGLWQMYAPDHLGNSRHKVKAVKVD